MSGFSSITDQPRAIQRLTALLRKGTIPHALLFTGLGGVGKGDTAIALAMAVNCSDRGGIDPAVAPCGECRSCRKIRNGSHPDVLVIRPAGLLIRIGVIRELIETMGLKPYEARHRVAVILDAQTMNPEAGNALLKLLEEPPDRTLLILTAPQPADLLPTIVSRCQHVRFNPIPRNRIQASLQAGGCDPTSAEILAAFAEGSLDRARELAGSGWAERRRWLLEELASLRQRPISERLALAEALAGKKDLLPGDLDLMAAWHRDLALFRFAPGKIMNRDFAPSVLRLSEESAMESILDKIGAIGSARRALTGNANPRLVLEALILKLGRD